MEDKNKFLTERGDGFRYNQGKLRYDLVDPKAHRDMVEVLTYGANKYKPRNWENGFSWSSVLASLKRHIAAIEMGEDYDQESGLLHVAHAACNIHFLNSFYYSFPQGDDRPKKFLKIPKIGLDVDGIIADFTGAWCDLYEDVNKDPISWYMDRKMVERFNIMKKNNSLNDFYMNIKPLIKPEDLPFVPHCYITSRPVDVKITENWLDLHKFPARPVYSVDCNTSKLDVAKDSGIEIFVDDSYNNFVELNNSGIFTYLYTQSWNKQHNVGHMRIDSLNDLPYFKV